MAFVSRRAFVAGAGAAAGSAAFNRRAGAAAPFAAWHDRTVADHNSEYARAFANGMGLVSLSIYGDPGNLRCAAVVMPRPEGVAEQQFVGLSQRDWQQRAAAMAKQGFGPVIVAATGPANNPVLAGAFRPLDPLPETAIGLTLENFRKRNKDVVSTGTAMLSWFDAYGAANDPRFVAVWAADPFGYGWTCGPDELSGKELQERFAQLHPVGARVDRVAMMPSGKSFAFMSERGGEATVWRADMTGEQYQAEVKAATARGLVPVRVHAKGPVAKARFAAVFAPREPRAERRFRSEGPRTIAEIDAGMEAWMRENGLHGVSLAIVDKTRLVYVKGYTWASQDYPDVRPTTLFRQASISKVFVGLSLYRLMQEQPSLTLETTVQSILKLRTPNGKPPTDPRFGAITLRHLIESTDGLNQGLMWREYDAAIAAKSAPPPTADQLASYIASVPLTGTPGDLTHTDYSNTGYFLASRVVAHLRRTATFTEALAPVLKPLHMTRVRGARSLFASQAEDEARYHVPDLPMAPNTRSSRRELVPSQYGGFDAENAEGTGGLSAAATDIARFAAMLALREGNPVLTPASYDAWLSNAALATKTHKGPLAHGYHGFDNVSAISRPRSGYRGEKGGSLAGTGTVVKFDTTGFSYVVASNGHQRPGAKVKLWEPLAEVTKKYQWPVDDLFPTFGMPSLPG